MLREKARCELHKDDAYCFGWILEAAPHETAVVWSLTSYLSKMSKTCWRIRYKYISEILLWTATLGHSCVGWPAKIYIHQLCANIGYCLEDLPRAMSDRDGWWVRLKGIHAVTTDDDDDDDTSFACFNLIFLIYHKDWSISNILQNYYD